MLKPKRLYQNQLILEPLALLFTRFVWTLVLLTPIILFWTGQDIIV